MPDKDKIMSFTPRAMSLAVATLTAGLFSTLTSAQAPDAKAMLAKGQQIATTVCAACHGADGNSLASANPSLAGQPAGYIAKQLTHFKSGVRDNAIMKGFATALSDDDMKAVGEYFSRQKPRIIGAKNLELAKTGEAIWRGGIPAKGVPACTACHGPSGAGIPAQYPRLGGQYAEYTYEELSAFAKGVRGNHDKDAGGKIMTAIAAKMNEAEMKAVAEYAAGLR
jgi:cytochrome c553